MSRLVGFFRILVDFKAVSPEYYLNDMDSYILSTMRYARERSLGNLYIHFHDGDEVIRLDREGTVYEFHPWSKFRSVACRLVRERRDIALFHMHSEGHHTILLGMLLRALGVPVCQFLQNDRRIHVIGAPDWLIKFNLKHVVRVLFVYTQYQKRRLLEEEGVQANIEVWPASVEAPAEPAAEWNPSLGPLEILYAGRISPQKDLLDLATGLASLPDPRRVRLRLAGPLAGQDMGYWAKVESCLREGGVPYEYLGYVEPAKLGKYYRSSHVLLNMRRDEGFGKVFIEAAAYGLPLLGRRGSAGPEELIREGRNGMLVDGPAQLAARLQEILAEPDKLRAIGLAARQEVMETRSLDVAYRFMERVFDPILAGRP